MATYKAEFLAHHYAGKLRPAAHYSMGWLPLLSALVTAVPGLAGAINTAVRTPGLAQLAKRSGGIAPQRELPRFTGQRFTRWDRHRTPAATGRRVILWPDTFTNYFHPEVGQAAVAVLERAGFAVEVPTGTVCCGLTWISTGQLGVAARVLRRSLRRLLPALRAGVPVVVLEPSCAAVFRSDAAELLGSDQARLLASRTKTLAELLTESGWTPRGLLEDLSGRTTVRAIAQVHCHQHAVLGFGPDLDLLKHCGVDVEVLDSGCCGLAGNFGFERGHYEVSAACAERGLWPAARDADPDTVLLADGFSCRTQLAAGHTGRQGVHLAQLLDRVTGPGG
jgi:Fe-S oxidoreductase